jgi:hypothetical protein
MILVFATGYLMWTENLQAFWLRGLFYTAVIMLFFAALIRIWWRNQFGPGRQLLFVAAGCVVGYGMMQASIQDWLSQQTGFQLMPFGLVNTTTGTVSLDNWTILGIFVIALVIVIVNIPKIKAELT